VLRYGRIIQVREPPEAFGIDTAWGGYVPHDDHWDTNSRCSMTPIDWAETGKTPAHGLIVPYIRRALADTKASTVADYACLDDGLATQQYDVHLSNKLVLFDNRVVPELANHYMAVDYAEQFWEPYVAHVGIAAMLLDRLGLDTYGHILDPKADTIALRNIWRTIKPKGTLIVIVPASMGDIIRCCRRAYSPRSLPRLVGTVVNGKYDMTFFTYHRDAWWQCNEYEVQEAPDDRIINIAAITLTKGEGNGSNGRH
jgi:hypothetical protein